MTKQQHNIHVNIHTQFEVGNLTFERAKPFQTFVSTNIITFSALNSVELVFNWIWKVDKLVVLIECVPSIRSNTFDLAISFRNCSHRIYNFMICSAIISLWMGFWNNGSNRSSLNIYFSTFDIQNFSYQFKPHFLLNTRFFIDNFKLKWNISYGWSNEKQAHLHQYDHHCGHGNESQ